MTYFSPDDHIKELGLTLEDLVTEDGWGELWRGEDEKLGMVLICAFTTDEGKQAFRDTLPSYKKWQSLAATYCSGLLKVHRIIDEGEIPMLIMENPGGETAREHFIAGWEDIKEGGLLAVACLDAIAHARNNALAPIGITPDTIFRNPDGKECPWKLLPVVPESSEYFHLLHGGRYVPPELKDTHHPEELNPDTYSVYWIWAEIVAQDTTIPHDLERLKEFIPYHVLHTLLTNGLIPLKGSYFEARVAVTAIQYWLKYDARDDRIDRKKKIEAEKRTPAQEKMYKAKEKIWERRKIIIQVAALLIIIGVIGLAGISIKNTFKAQKTPQTAYGLIALYFDALIDRNLEEALKYTQGEGNMGTNLMFEKIKWMEEKHLASRFAQAAPEIRGSGSPRLIRVALKGENGDLFMRAEVTVKKMDSGEWIVEKVFFEPLRKLEEE